MKKVTFNAKALGVSRNPHRTDMGHTERSGPSVAVVGGDTQIESLFERLGFTDVKRFPRIGNHRST
ncbi:hypothetical protein SAMN04488011_10548 [Palleronia pelagia]|uniref:Uncharacterized protein n=1 Tax=Palleronia pelagia TaxID=387096 RepID=A0A1H8HYZ2_9RHOB|nr:hypothetical protein SAMN04488011_10548 [Palleronia pelagia]